MMKHTKTCIAKYMEQGHLRNIAVKVGKNGKTFAEIYKSSETELNCHTLFDMASVTKVMATTVLCYIALDKGHLKLTDKVSQFYPVPEDKKEMSVLHLLTHTMGIGHKNLVADGNTYENIAEFILNIPSDVKIGSDTLYSCPGYILLGKILEKVFGERLDTLFIKYIANPLKLQFSSFLPTQKDNVVNSNASEAERGIVNDYNCKFLGGVAGNAGLFSCVEDATKFVEMLLRKGAPLFSEELFLKATKNYTEACADSRALGFLYVDEKYSQTGSLFPKGSIGHCGHTGQSVFLDVQSGLYVIILSDATISISEKYGTEKYNIVMQMRQDIHNAIKTDLEGKR